MGPAGHRVGRAAAGARACSPAEDHEDCSHGSVGVAWPAAEWRRANATFGHRMNCQHISGQFKLVNRCVIYNFVGLIKQKATFLWTSLLIGKGKKL